MHPKHFQFLRSVGLDAVYRSLEAAYWDNLAAKARLNKKLSGFQHDNYRLDVDGKSYLFRFPMSGITIMDPNAFKEADILRLLANVDITAPALIYEGNNYLVEEFITGDVVDDKYPPGATLPESMLDAMAELLKKLSEVEIQKDQVQQFIDPSWGMDGAMQSFSRQVIACSEAVFERNFQMKPDVYEFLGIKENPYKYFIETSKHLGLRPWKFIHGDISRGNTIIDADGSVSLIDWQLALYGDPMYDIGKHIHMWRYTNSEIDIFVRKLKNTLAPEFLANFDHDLAFYMNLEALKSVITDVIRFPQVFEDGRFTAKKEAELCLYFTDNLKKIAPLIGCRTAEPDEAFRWFQEWGR